MVFCYNSPNRLRQLPNIYLGFYKFPYSPQLKLTVIKQNKINLKNQMFDVHNAEYPHIFDDLTLYFFLDAGVQMAIECHDSMFPFCKIWRFNNNILYH